MLIVADSSPVNILVRVGQVEILPKLFTSVVVPPQVLAELSDPRTPSVVQKFVATPPSWFVVRPVRLLKAISGVDPGEEAAINLAVELAASLLIDDYDGRKAAVLLGLRIIGTLGVLQQADGRGLLELPKVLAAIQTTDFRLAQGLIDAALARRNRRR